MYPLDGALWGPTVRITSLRRELDQLVELDVVSGYRGARRIALARYATSGRLRGLDGIYVESSSFLPAEADIAFLALARGLGIRVLTYVRDAYQLFPVEYPRKGWRGWLAGTAFRPSIALLRLVSSTLAFPTEGLARAVMAADATQAVLLPPGAPDPIDVQRDPTAATLLFVGDARLPAHGADRLLAAVGLARDAGVDVDVTIVCRPGQEPPGARPDWLEIRRAEGDEIHALLAKVLATVIPRPRSPYNDLALPVKLFDYLSYGRPLLVTDCTEQARVVGEAGAGLVVGDGIEALADGIRRLFEASRDDLDRWSAAARRAAGASPWSSRAARIVGVLTHDLSRSPRADR